MTARDEVSLAYSHFRLFSPLTKALIIGGALVALLLVGSGVGAMVSGIKDRHFDAQQAKEAAARGKVEAERDAAIKRAEAAEAQAAVYGAQAEALKKVAEDAARNVAATDAKVKGIEDAKQKSIDAIHSGDMSPADADADIRARLRALHYLP